MSNKELTIVDVKGAKKGSVAVPAEVFEQEPRPSVVHQVVRWQLAKKRQGTHATLNRSKMTGGGKKPFKQKGTGNARAGTRNSPLWRGGAVIFGPQPRSYEFKLPKKVKTLALRSAISDKCSQDAIIVVDDFSLSQPKTKEAVAVLEALGQKGKKVLCVISDEMTDVEKAFVQAVKNVQKVRILQASALNVYDIVCSQTIIMNQKALESVVARVGNEQKEAA